MIGIRSGITAKKLHAFFGLMFILASPQAFGQAAGGAAAAGAGQNGKQCAAGGHTGFFWQITLPNSFASKG